MPSFVENVPPLVAARLDGRPRASLSAVFAPFGDAKGVDNPHRLSSRTATLVEAVASALSGTPTKTMRKRPSAP